MVGQELLGFFGQAHQSTGDLKQGAAHLSQFDASAAAQQKFDPVALLELLDLRGDGGLTDIQRLRRRRETCEGG
jgi:hypothetical protein